MTMAEQLQQVYSVRCWDMFYKEWTMIPITNLTREEAIKTALMLAVENDSDIWYTEYQVYVDCLAYNTAQMVGYVEFDNDGYRFVESFS